MYGWWRDDGLNNDEYINIETSVNDENLHLKAFYIEWNPSIEYGILKIEFDENTERYEIISGKLFRDSSQIYRDEPIIYGNYQISNNYMAGILVDKNENLQDFEDNTLKTILVSLKNGLLFTACKNKDFIKIKKMSNIRCIIGELTSGVDRYVGCYEIAGIGKFIGDHTIFNSKTVHMITHTKSENRGRFYAYGLALDENLSIEEGPLDYPVLLLNIENKLIDVYHYDSYLYYQYVKSDYENYFEKYIGNEINIEIYGYVLPKKVLSHIWQIKEI